jgi:L-fuconolactonase
MTILAPVTRMPDLIPLLDQNPEMTVVIDHMADCPLHQPAKFALFTYLARYPRVFVKISHMWSLSNDPYPYADKAARVRQLNIAFGRARLMWGTDWPICLKQLSYPRAVALCRNHLDFLAPADRDQILHKTVQKIWSFLPT